MDERFDCIAVIGRQCRQRAERFGLKPLVGLLAGFTVLPLVGDFFQPLPCLRIDVSQIGEGTQRPEVLANIADGTLDFTFGEKRALQTVTRVDYKFSLSRIRSIH